ncbi:MAG: ATP-binding protein [Desulfobacteraceae bacterium]|nr:ATP-binding protein [Desulfobacteraceae bacterium]MBC2719777.1 ATP-binding protein [Desulfobacteraceae bacterium]
MDKRVLKRATFIYDEAIFLLKEELREPTNYELILEAISKGKSKMSLIADETGIAVHNIQKYLRVLINLGFIAKEYPVCLKKNKGIRSASIYKVSDNLFSFWYRYVFPVRSELETNRKAVIN